MKTPAPQARRSFFRRLLAILRRPPSPPVRPIDTDQLERSRQARKEQISKANKQGMGFYGL